MPDESSVEFVGKMNPQKLTSLEEDFKQEQAEMLADQAHWAKYGTNRSKNLRRLNVKLWKS